jgi:hypothetical protein
LGKRQGKAKFLMLREAVSQMLRETDPIGLIGCGAPLDEYDPEVGTILPRLRGATSASDIHRIVHEEFVRWFGAETAGGPEAYEQTAQRIWEVVNRDEAV